MSEEIRTIQEKDQVKLDIRKKVLFVEDVKGVGLDKSIILTGVATGRYKLKYDSDEGKYKFFRQYDEEKSVWKSPRFVRSVEIVDRNTSKAELYV